MIPCIFSSLGYDFYVLYSLLDVWKSVEVYVHAMMKDYFILLRNSHRLFSIGSYFSIFANFNFVFHVLCCSFSILFFYLDSFIH